MTEKDVTVVVELEITGAAGGVVSPGIGSTLRVMTTAADAGDVLSTASFAFTVKMLAPLSSITPENEKVPVPLVVVVPTEVPSLNSSTTE